MKNEGNRMRKLTKEELIIWLNTWTCDDRKGYEKQAYEQIIQIIQQGRDEGEA